MIRLSTSSWKTVYKPWTLHQVVSNDVMLIAKLRARWPNGPIGRRALSHVRVYVPELESLLEILYRIRLAKEYVSLKQRNAPALNISLSLLPIGRFA